MEKMKNEELQSRREFFKKAAKGALPILGAILLAGTPTIASAMEGEYCPCKGTCVGSCTGGCGTSCKGTCDTTCKGTCRFTCDSTCKHHSE